MTSRHVVVGHEQLLNYPNGKDVPQNFLSRDFELSFYWLCYNLAVLLCGLGRSADSNHGFDDISYLPPSV